MSTLPDNALDLEKLFLPAWAQESATPKSYAHFEGGDERPRRGDDRDRRGGPRPPRRDGDRGAAPRRDGDRNRPGGSGGRGAAGVGPGDRSERRERPEPPPALPEVSVTLMPEEKGVESLARQIKSTGRAFPLFDIARLILEKPERYVISFAVEKRPDGSVAQQLFLCAMDDTLWVSENEAVTHVLKKHFDTFYQSERTATEPPKGSYTFVAQCGFSGEILGPPNYHDYQNQLRKLHAERFARMPFDAFKARVRIVRDEEVVKKWVEGLSWKTEYIGLNIPEPLRLHSLEEVEKHFREVHKDAIIKPVDRVKLGGVAARNLRSPGLLQLVRQACEDQRRFPLQLATILSQQFAGHGLQFFKVNKTLTHVSVARPHFLDLDSTPVSEMIKQIIAFIDKTPKCTRRKLLEALAPVTAPAAASEAASGEVPAPAEPAQASPQQSAVIMDLHWLIHQGHVIEFANGTLETAKKPLPKPPQQPRPQPKKSPAAQAKPVSAQENTPAQPAPPDAPLSEPSAESNAVVEALSPEPEAPVAVEVPTPAEAAQTPVADAPHTGEARSE